MGDKTLRITIEQKSIAANLLESAVMSPDSAADKSSIDLARRAQRHAQCAIGISMKPARLPDRSPPAVAIALRPNALAVFGDPRRAAI
ncbi:hypothetical protein GCM10027413_06120 [Conyzicola nivalis]|uniref:Uncharacterized protein n=1 Tax=Conyzicola nivalis TaxID=1477021 RepID=A0A916WK77_9MICO|nr:hypothetical protein GCM10010979_20510 [Conyzicola nivalis]